MLQKKGLLKKLKSNKLRLGTYTYCAAKPLGSEHNPGTRRNCPDTSLVSDIMTGSEILRRGWGLTVITVITVITEPSCCGFDLQVFGAADASKIFGWSEDVDGPE